MQATMSRDYELVLGKLSLDLDFANGFFTDADQVLAQFDLTEYEKANLLSLDRHKFEEFKMAQTRRGCDCDSCCNGGEPSGNCSECSAACCQ